MKRTTLRDSLKQIFRHPPSKLNASLISEIYTKWTAPEELHDFLASGIFKNVLWPFFHIDATNTHLELLLQIASYEYEVLSLTTCIDLILQDEKKLQGLIHRLLQSSMTSRKQDERFQASIFVFLRTLVLLSPATLTEHAVFPKWQALLIPSYTEALSSSQLKVSDPAFLRHGFLSFALGCILLSLDICRKLVLASWLPFHFLEDSADFFSHRISQLICLRAYPTPPSSFVVFQQAVLELGLKNFQIFEFVSLPLDVSREEFVENLQEVPLPEKLRLCELMNCPILQDKATLPVLHAVITHFALGCSVSYSALLDYTNCNENDVFDLFELRGALPFVPAPTFPVSQLVSTLLIDQIKITNTYEYLSQINSRVVSVLERLTISDPALEQGVKGSSKYFSRIQKVDIAGAKARVECNNKKMRQGFKPDDHVLLMELSKPNRAGNGSREVKYGVDSCVITKVISAEDIVRVNWNFDGFEDRFNYLVVIPSPVSDSTFCANDDSLIAALEKFETVGSESDDDHPKRRKLENGNSASGDLSSAIHKTPMVIDSSNISEAAEKFKLFFSDSPTKAVSVRGLRGNEKANMIKAFLTTLNAHFKHESCLVVMPTKSAVDLLHLDLELSAFCFHHNSTDVHVAMEIERLRQKLNEVSTLSEKLGLQEYDFSSLIRNALMLYHSHIQPKWKDFLKLLTKERYTEYPFADITGENFDKAMRDIVDDYREIRSIFAWLEERLPLDNFQLQKLSAADSLEIQKYLSTRCKYLVIAEENLHLVDKTYDNVIAHDASVLPRIKGGFHRFLFLGNGLQMPKQVVSNALYCRNEIARLVREPGMEISPSFNPGFKYCLQHVKVTSSKEESLVDEASLCVSIYQYMRLLGYPWWSILIATKSEQMKSLIGEILHERSILKSDTPADEGTFLFGYPIVQDIKTLYPTEFLVVACFGAPSLSDYHKIAELSLKGLYLVGSEKNFPYEIKSGGLELVPDERYSTTERRDRSAVTISSASNMCERVDGLISKNKASV